MAHIILAESDTEISRCYPVMLQLRPTLAHDDFVSRVQLQQALYDYELALLEDEGEVRAVTGFRISHNLAYGKFLYIDDLVTDSSQRSKGYGDMLFDWLVDYARKESCVQFHLDSGVQRFDAHRFYMRKRMKISSYHFSLPLE